MFESFVEWLDEQVRSRGLAKVLTGLVTLLGIAGILGTLFGSFPARAAALVVVFLIALSTSLFLFGGRRIARRDISTLSALVRHYTEVVEKISDVTLEVSRWRQTVEINQRGDAVVTRRITFTPSGGELHYMHLNLSYYGGSRHSDRMRRNVKAVAREISVEEVQGARYRTTLDWIRENELQLSVHFDEPISRGNSVSVEVRWNWPLFSSDLVEGGVETFDVRFSFPVERAEHEVKIRKKSRTDNFSVSPTGSPTEVRSDQTDTEFSSFFAVDHPVGRQKYGVRLDKQ